MKSMLTQYEYLTLNRELISKLVPQPFQEHDYNYLLSITEKGMFDGMRGLAVTHLNRVIAISGIVKLWEGRWQGWALYAENLDGRDFVFLRKSTKSFIEEHLNNDVNRIEITVLLDFVNGHHYAKSLGFIPEGIMRCYDMLGRDHVLYARIKNGP